MFESHNMKADINTNGVTIYTDPKTALALIKQLNLEPSEQLKNDILKECKKLFGDPSTNGPSSNDNIEFYKDKCDETGNKKLHKLLNLVKPQIKTDYYYNDIDTSIIDPEMYIVEIVQLYNLDRHIKDINNVNNKNKDKIERLESKKEKIIKGGYKYGDRPDKLTKYNEINKKIYKIQSKLG